MAETLVPRRREAGRGWSAGGSGSTTTYCAFDAHGSVSVTTDSSGDAVSKHGWDAYGTSIGSAPSGPFGYGAQWGYFTDSETGLCALAFRAYDPATGRFLTRDPIGYAGGVNLYGYVGNGPASGADPWGLRRREPDPPNPRIAVIFVGNTDVLFLSHPFTQNGINNEIIAMRKQFEKDGYLVRVDRTGTREDILAALRDPNTKAIGFNGHMIVETSYLECATQPGTKADSEANFLSPEDVAKALRGRVLESAIIRACYSNTPEWRAACVGKNGKWSGVDGLWNPALRLDMGRGKKP